MINYIIVKGFYILISVLLESERNFPNLTTNVRNLISLGFTRNFFLFTKGIEGKYLFSHLPEHFIISISRVVSLKNGFTPHVKSCLMKARICCLLIKPWPLRMFWSPSFQRIHSNKLPLFFVQNFEGYIVFDCNKLTFFKYHSTGFSSMMVELTKRILILIICEQFLL